MTTLATKTQGYDLAGNLTLAYSADRGTSYTYRWDHHNRLTGVYDSTNITRVEGSPTTPRVRVCERRFIRRQAK